MTLLNPTRRGFLQSLLAAPMVIGAGRFIGPIAPLDLPPLRMLLGHSHMADALAYAMQLQNERVIRDLTLFGQAWSNPLEPMVEAASAVELGLRREETFARLRERMAAGPILLPNYVPPRPQKET